MPASRKCREYREAHTVDAAGSRRALRGNLSADALAAVRIAVSASPQVVRAMKHDVSFELSAPASHRQVCARARRA